jgi:hypothetical protein
MVIFLATFDLHQKIMCAKIWPWVQALLQALLLPSRLMYWLLTMIQTPSNTHTVPTDSFHIRLVLVEITI